MKRKALVLLAAMACVAGASQVRGQLGFSAIKRPNIASIFHPVVGAGTTYEETKKDGKKSTMEMSIVGSEMFGEQQGYWMEVGHADNSTEPATYGKMLVTPADCAFHKVIFAMPGSKQPMEMEWMAPNRTAITWIRNWRSGIRLGTKVSACPRELFPASIGPRTREKATSG